MNYQPSSPLGFEENGHPTHKWRGDRRTRLVQSAFTCMSPTQLISVRLPPPGRTWTRAHTPQDGRKLRGGQGGWVSVEADSVQEGPAALLLKLLQQLVDLVLHVFSVLDLGDRKATLSGSVCPQPPAGRSSCLCLF